MLWIGCGASWIAAMGGQCPAPGNPEVGPRQGLRSRIVFQRLGIAVCFVPLPCVQRRFDRMAIEPQVVMTYRARCAAVLRPRPVIGAAAHRHR